ncbi:MAG: hypothetical protein L5657_08500 [Calditerricola sp.]|jgi:hypothetical protein|nr:hypothetical protein [Bacillota bacterium]MCG0314674.1 hypothetical protein [Calditerricola sp.]
MTPRAILREERPTYRLLLLRKNHVMKRGETAAFLIGLVLLGEVVGYGSTAFKVGAIGLAIAVLAVSPLFWKWWWQPRYVLTPDELVVETRRARRVIPLETIAPAYDLRFIYRIDGRRTPLPVSDAFLDVLEEQLVRRNVRRP